MPLGSALTEQQVASNAALYADIVKALTNNELPPQVGIIYEDMGVISLTSLLVGYADDIVHIFFFYKAEQIFMTLSPDGSATSPL